MQSRKKHIKNKNKRNKGHTFKNKKARGGVTPDGSAGPREGEVNQQVVGEVNQPVVEEVNQSEEQSGEQSEEQQVIESTKNKIPLLVATKKGCKLHLEADTEQLTFWYSFTDGLDETEHVTATNDDEFSKAIIRLDTAVKERLSKEAMSGLDESESEESKSKASEESEGLIVEETNKEEEKLAAAGGMTVKKFELDTFGVNNNGSNELPADIEQRYAKFYEKYKDRIFYQVNSNNTSLEKCKLIPPDPNVRWLEQSNSYNQMRFIRQNGNDIGSVISFFNIYPIKQSSDEEINKVAKSININSNPEETKIIYDNTDEEVLLELAVVFGNLKKTDSGYEKVELKNKAEEAERDKAGVKESGDPVVLADVESAEALGKHGIPPDVSEVKPGDEESGTLTPP
jgi:hypothetical protein